MNNLERKELTTKGLKDKYSAEADYTFECGGRFEIIGNHTDHNHGLCLAATCDLSIIASVKYRNDKIVRFSCNGFDDFQIDLSNLDIRIKEKGSSLSFIRGIAKYLSSKGYKVGGFDCYAHTTIAKGSGASSSAAFSMLISEIFNKLFNEDKISLLELAKASQYAEVNYFGKACGLQDQIATGSGGITYIDFKDIDNLETINIKDKLYDVEFVVIETEGDHSGLSSLYDSIPNDMKNAAKKNGKDYLRDVINFKEEGLTPNEIKRARHFYSENQRVIKGFEAIKNHDVKTLIQLANESSDSSKDNLENTTVNNIYKGSIQEAIDVVRRVCPNASAKVNGGGFRGTIICIIPKIDFPKFNKEIKKHYKEDKIHHIHIKYESVGTI